jgi:dienelactone hydrolase
MIPVAVAIGLAVRDRGVIVRRPIFRLRGWNGEQASPVHDMTEELDEIRRQYGPVPVVLVGHSLGARAVLRSAGHPSVTAVAGLAPWVPPGEPVDQLAGRSVLLVQGTIDTITPAAETWAYAGRAQTVTTVTEIEVRGGEHTMIRRASLWHALAAAFTCVSLGLPAPPGPAADALTATGRTAV